MKIDDAAARLEALGNPTRLRIYRALVRAGDAGIASASCRQLDLAGSTLSHHLKALIAVGLIVQERQATTLICRANYDVMRGMVDFLVAECCVETTCAPAACRSPNRPHKCFASYFDISRRRRSHASRWQAKTVAVIGAGPVGLAAAAHLLERGLEPVVLEAGPRSATRSASGRTCGCSRRGSTPSTRRPRACSSRRAGTRRSPTPTPPAANWLSATSSRSRRVRALDRIHTSARVTGIGRVGFDKVKTNGRAEAPFELRYRNGRATRRSSRRRGDRRLGHVVRAQPGRRRRPAGDRRARGAARIAYGMPDVLGARAQPLRRQARRRAGRRPLRGRHADRSCSACGRGRAQRSSGSFAATTRQNRSAAAPTTSWSERGALGAAGAAGRGRHASRSRRASA